MTCYFSSHVPQVTATWEMWDWEFALLPLTVIHEFVRSIPSLTCRRKSQILSSIHGRVCLKILFRDDVATWVMHGK